MKKLLFTIMFLFSFLLTGSFTDFNSANAQRQVNLSIIKTKPIGHPALLFSLRLSILMATR